MKAFLAVLICSAIGSFLFWLIGSSFGNTAGAVAANAALFLLLLAYAGTRPRRLTAPTLAASAGGATIFLAACAIVGSVIFDRSHVLGNVMMAAVSVGYYPPGPDVPLFPGMFDWGISALAVIAAGLGLGTLLPRKRPDSLPAASKPSEG
ncbi:MAG: hypothetical protein QOH04_2051 [Sphingomonadales bacterium]|jgi:hypothetical protein|nr:hypothetical protein [Sphingomonadales bacterium]